MIRAIVTLGLLLAAACAPVANTPNPPPSAERVAITLERSPCFGFCPDYTVRIDQDGGVVYVGRNFVAVTGEQRAQISPAEVTRLLERFESVHFMSLRDEYRAEVSDLPSYTVTLERGATRKSVLDYGGTMVGMPEAMRALQDEIDRVAGTSRWVQRDGKPVRN